MLASVRRSRVLFPSVTEIMELRRWTSLANGPGALLASGSSVLESQWHTATLAFLKRNCRDHTSALTLVWQILHHLSHFPSQGFFFLFWLGLLRKALNKMIEDGWHGEMGGGI